MSVIEKSPDAFRTISEAADELGVPAHVLRFWESKFPQINPLKRAGGRRFYRPQDIVLLRGVKRLLYEDGFTIKGARKYIKDHGVSSVVELGTGGSVREPRAVDVSDLESTRAPRPLKPRPAGSPTRDLDDILGDLENARAKLRDVLKP
jgi:DNA-binding transcriptional MerR regulator